MLDYFFRHYEAWVDRFYVYDDASDDGSWEYLAARRDVVLQRTPRSDPDSWVASARTLYDNDWKRSRGEADWVVVTNLDEHLHHPNMRAYLEAALGDGITAIPAPGYQMLTETYPAADALLCRDHPWGAPDRAYSRLALFRPDQVQETRFSPGRHLAYAIGRLITPQRHEVVNLHYKYLGVTETYRRQQMQGKRLGPRDHANGWGTQYLWSEAVFNAYVDRLRQQCVDVSRIRRHDPKLFWWPHREDD